LEVSRRFFISSYPVSGGKCFLIINSPASLQCTPPTNNAGNNVLTVLDLGQNGIGDRGAAALAEALKLNTTLHELDLSGNAVDKDGAAALAEAIAENTMLGVSGRINTSTEEGGDLLGMQPLAQAGFAPCSVASLLLCLT
jgi:hypothetical protein